MYKRGLSAALSLAVIVLMVGLLAGCGGGDQSGSGAQQGGKANAGQGKKTPGEQGKNAPGKKILLGTVTFVNPKTEGFSVKPTMKEQGKKPVAFRPAKNVKITLAGKEAKLEDMKKGQQAQVEYVVRNDRNRARSIRLFEGGEPSKKDGGNPPKKEDNSSNDKGGSGGNPPEKGSNSPNDQGGEKTG